VENLLLRGLRPLVSAIYQNQPLSHYLPPNMQLLQGPNGQVKLRVSSLLNNQRALLEKQRGFDNGIKTEEEIKELKKLGFVPRDKSALFRPKKSASEDA
jgi:hypothetical protein